MRVISRGRNTLALVACALLSCVVVVYYLHVTGGISTPNAANWGLDKTFSLFGRGRYQWRPEYADLNGPSTRYDDPKVLDKLKKHHLHRWVTDNYNLTDNNLDYEPSMGQSQIVRSIFQNDNKDKFFVECGALDGETRSNTLYLERTLGWNGILIEADPSNFLQLIWKRRKSWASDTCLSTKPYPTMVSFEQKANQGKISSYLPGYLERGYVDVQCFPFASYMAVLNRTRIDYFSLDVEGLELEILKTIDFDKFDIKVLSVEFIHDKEGKDAIEEFMLKNGYYVKTLVTHPNWLANDFIFVKEKFRSKSEEKLT